ncbi:MAG: hypothetical protein UX91_C0001G0023 [Candidatus Amesbacteria bacterium GW2011_GWB1_47_19]|nr:MAG: hypothetical protein UW51_C0001G0023 [Candidatus Amesbacteria bacterium GW2011_GWA1_44_24]KKU32035.1 MAG: hypothetical protein UX46_C0001G0022 [Candidatus Amesbacteria bacterium GW2011_GWC1_46_24]KKU67719.1 MAG: hypothetical protein UX91_C0001G0023 [Candidatus Amesbacteria bacterium GW2011_GWB1_47_19]OGD06098.1 MAG: hypothetical protein A2379_03320 [Candidatus Amesbacteria bacterium RIFOXYB1_FULL_47_13]HBC72311.1 hypothetical protein [Candidatus Amesbacteria bacterium]
MATKKITKSEKITTDKKIRLKTMTIDELKNAAVKIREQIVKARMESVTGKAKNMRQVFWQRKQLARILTEISIRLFKDDKIRQNL